MSASHDTLMAAFDAEPKPITSARAVELARQTLPRLQAEQFVKWFETNGDHLLGNLNGN